jgi:hypothetical protein
MVPQLNDTAWFYEHHRQMKLLLIKYIFKA